MKTIRNSIALILTTAILSQSFETQAQSWGRSTTGTVIGAGAGAAAGAIINKQNRAVGGVVGGILGGASGYAIAKQGKKHWSPQAKGTAIGAGVGGAAGAVINKRNRVVGGIIGGVAGGAAGYAIGKHIDNKHKKAEAERVAAAERASVAERAAAERESDRLAAETKATEQSNKNASQPVIAAVAYKGSTPVQPVALLAAKSMTASYILKDGYLINDSFGDPNAPYGTSEYRRKSW